MSTPWNPTLPVTRPLVEGVLRDQLPAPDLTELRHLNSGWDHDVWRCGPLLLRFPHQVESGQLAANNVPLLKALAGCLPTPIPVPRHVGVPTSEYPARFVAYDWIEGQMPAEMHLTTAQRCALALPLATALRALHNIPLDSAQRWGAATQDKEDELQLRARFATKRVTQLANGPHAALAARARSAMEPVPSPGDGSAHRLVHGDLHPGQLLLTPDARLAGIIDWDEAHIGDPAYDLLLVYAFLPSAGRRVFWQRYGDRECEQRARYLALSFGLAVLAQASAEGKHELVSEAAFGLENALTSAETA